MNRNVAAFIALCCSSLSASAGQGPIRLIFDMHMDPILNGQSFAQKQATYQTWITNANWVLDQTEPIGAKISFASTGPFMELLVNEGSNGNGAALLQRLYASGAQIGSHSHTEYRAAAFNWPNLMGMVTLAQATQSWQDNVTWVNNGIMTAWNGSPPEPLSAINCTKGAHVPSSALAFEQLMQQFGFLIRPGGPEEDYYGFYGHYIWNPFRPSATSDMTEDLTTPFVVPTQGSVIGLAQVHHNVFQDMTAPAVKRMFLQTYVNWRHAHRTSAIEKVWTAGWGSHGSDYDVGDPSRPAVVEVLAWLQTHFANRLEPDGADVMTWDTQRGAAQAYFTWEAAHAGQSSFTFNGSVVDWDEYPYSRPVAEELRDFMWVADLSLGSGVDAFHLRRGTTDAVLAWRTSGTATYDFSAWVGSGARSVGLETGVHYGVGSSAVELGMEPLLVTEDTSCRAPANYCIGAPNSVGTGAQIDWSGSTSVASNNLVLISRNCPPGTNGIFYFGTAMQATPFGDGVRCVGGSITRLPIVSANASGTAQFALDYNALAPAIAVGEIRNFQFWYRDVGGPGGTSFNLSDALNVRFCP